MDYYFLERFALVFFNNRELKIHQIHDADVTKNCRYYHSFTSRVKSMDCYW
jgi:hypothetical protein